MKLTSVKILDSNTGEEKIAELEVDVEVPEGGELPTVGEDNTTYYVQATKSIYRWNNETQQYESYGGSGQQLDNNIQIFNDYENNETNIPYSFITGKNNKAIVKGFQIVDTNTYTPYIVLNSVEGIAIGDNVILFYVNQNQQTVKCRGSVVSISNRALTIDNASFNEAIKDGNIKGSETLSNSFINNGSILIVNSKTAVPDTEVEFPDNFSPGATLTGNDNIGSLFSAIFGDDNEVLGYAAFAAGCLNTVSGERGAAFGYDNEVRGNEAFAANERNEASGYASFASGYKTKARGQGAFSCGEGGLAAAEGSFVSNIWCEATEKGASATGTETKANHDSAWVGGVRTISGDAAQVVFGKFNLPTQGAEIVGGGQGPGNARKNIRELDWEGNERLAGILEVGKNPINDMDVVPKKYFEEETFSLVNKANYASGIIQTVLGEKCEIYNADRRPLAGLTLLGFGNFTEGQVAAGTKIIISPSVNLWGGTKIITKTYDVFGNINLSKGIYTFSTMVTSTDSDSDTCLISIAMSDGSSKNIQCPRGMRYAETIELTGDITTIRLYNSNNYDNSVGDSSEWKDIMFEYGTSMSEYEYPIKSYDDVQEIIVPVSLGDGDLWNILTGEVIKADNSSVQVEPYQVSLISSTVKILQIPLEVAGEITAAYVADTELYLEKQYIKKENMVWQTPLNEIDYTTTIEIPANKMNNIAILTGAVDITLATGIEGFDNEWSFVITQGETAQTISLPEIHWGLGIAPTFLANSITQCRLYYIGSTLCGEWVSI